jgi:hypothetical protein
MRGSARSIRPAVSRRPLRDSETGSSADEHRLSFRRALKSEGRSPSDRQNAALFLDWGWDPSQNRPGRKKRRSPTVRTFYALAERPFANKRRFACSTRNRQISFSAELIDDGPGPLRQRANVVGALKRGPSGSTLRHAELFCSDRASVMATSTTAPSAELREPAEFNPDAPWTKPETPKGVWSFPKCLTAEERE